jgi:hypothetical protein
MCFPRELRPASNIVLRACAKAARIMAGLMTDYGEIGQTPAGEPLSPKSLLGDNVDAQ